MSEGRRYALKNSIKNWAAYNEGLKRRYDLTIYIEDESIFDPPEPTGQRGRSIQYSKGLVEAGLTMTPMYRFKTSFGERMFSRTFTRQKTTAIIKAKTLNTCRACAFPPCSKSRLYPSAPQMLQFIQQCRSQLSN